MAQPGLILVWSKGMPQRTLIPIPWNAAFEIGRSLVPDDDRTSAKHATIYARPGLDPDFIVTNMQSRNGTFVDGKEQTHSSAWNGSVIRTGSSLFIATTDLAREEPRIDDAFAIYDTARGRLPIHYSLVDRCLRSLWKDRGELVAAVEAAAVKAARDDRIGEEHLPPTKPRIPTVSFAKFFEQTMQAPPPFEIPATYHVHTLERLANGVPHETLISSDKTAPALVQTQLGDTLAKQPGYFMAGFWGHGVNSYAVYLARTTERSRLFLRLPYGAGAYSAAGERERALEQLQRFSWLADTLPVAHITLLDSMGTAYYELVRHDGRVLTSPDKLHSLDQIDFLTLALPD